MLAKDQWENVFAFTGPGDSIITDCFSIAAKLWAFYNYSGPATTQDNQLSFYMSTKMAPEVSIKIYNQTDPKPRPPAFSALWGNTAPGDTGASSLPEEIALCLSFYSFLNRPRQRGRIYLGPLGVHALSPGSEQDSRPNPNFLADMAKAGNYLMSHDGQPAFYSSLTSAGGTQYVAGSPYPTVATTTPWCVHSRTGGTVRAPGSSVFESVTAGWVDNEWDGQSRRRVAASARTSF